MTAAVSDIRDARGRFKPGRSGNPAGKPPGTRNWSSRLKGAVDEATFDAVARKTVEEALGGSGVDRRFIISHLDPRPRLPPVALPTGGTLIERCDWIWDAMATGEITPDQAATAARQIDVARRLLAEPPIDHDALRAELKAELRAELAAEIRAEVIAALRTEIIAEFGPPPAAAPEFDLNPQGATPAPEPPPRPRPATWRNAATIERMLRNAGAPAVSEIQPKARHSGESRDPGARDGCPSA
jgi:hypothetical protein